MPNRRIIFPAAWTHLPNHESRTSRPTEAGDTPMKNLILAALAAVSLTGALAPLANAAALHNGSTLAGDAAATRIQQTGQYGQ
jgi:hypothetical protein